MITTIVCDKKECKYCGGTFCTKGVVGMGKFGLCEVWFDKEGRLRQSPLYEIEPETEYAS